MAGHVVTGTLRSERVPVTVQAENSVSITSSLLHAVTRLLARYWLELTYVVALLMLWSSASEVTPALGPIVVVTFVTAMCWYRPTRRYFAKQLRIRCIRRRFDDAVRHGGLATHNDHVPEPVWNGITMTPAGERLRVRIPSGSTAEQLESVAELIATHLEVRDVRVSRDTNNARYATVDVVRRDPLADATALPWPQLHAAQLSMWEPIPVGLDEFGEVVALRLVGQNRKSRGTVGVGGLR